MIVFGAQHSKWLLTKPQVLRWSLRRSWSIPAGAVISTSGGLDDLRRVLAGVLVHRLPVGAVQKAIEREQIAVASRIMQMFG